MRESKSKSNSKKIIIEEASNSKEDEYKSAGFCKRLVAYIIDIILISLTFSVVSFIVPISEKAKTINEELVNVQTQYIDKKITFQKYEDKILLLNYEYSKETYISSLINLVLTILYFVVYQYKNKMTIGKKFMGLKVIKEPGEGELQINDMIYRSLIINSLFSSIATLSILFLLKQNNYIIVNSYITLFQIALIASTIGYMIIRKDKKSLHDILTKTKVVETK